MNARKLPKGQSGEQTTDGRSQEPGIYVHKESGTKFITSDGMEGSIQADALNSPIWRGGWERVGDVPTRLELLAMREAQAKKDAKDDPEADKKVK